MLEIHCFPEYWFSRTTRHAGSPHQSPRRKLGVMASRLPIPYLRLMVCGTWVALALLTFLMVGGSSARSVVYLVAAAIIPPFVFIGLWNDGPPPTVGEILRNTEDAR